MDYREEKRTPYMGVRGLRDGSVTMDKLSDEVRERVETCVILGDVMDIEEFDQLEELEPGKLYIVTQTTDSNA